jgi:hypothetical protein
MAQIPLINPIVIQPEVTSNNVEVVNYVDSPTQFFVNAYINMNPNSNNNPVYQTLILWEGAEYVAIGNWTTQEAEARIQQILNTQP